jgi:hypothetical protein
MAKKAFSKVEAMAQGLTPSPKMRIQVGMKTPAPGRFIFPTNGQTPERLLLTGPKQTDQTS